MTNLPALNLRNQFFGSFCNVVRARVTGRPILVASQVLAAGFFVCLQGVAQAGTPPGALDIQHEAGCRVTDGVKWSPEIKQLGTQNRPDLIGDGVEFASSISVNTEPVAQKCPAQEAQASPQKSGAGAGEPDSKRIKVHWTSYIFFFVSAFLAGALGAFLGHAFKHGIASAWRDVCWSLGLPYWMCSHPDD